MGHEPYFNILGVNTRDLKLEALMREFGKAEVYSDGDGSSCICYRGDDEATLRFCRRKNGGGYQLSRIYAPDNHECAYLPDVNRSLVSAVGFSLGSRDVNQSKDFGAAKVIDAGPDGVILTYIDIDKFMDKYYTTKVILTFNGGEIDDLQLSRTHK